MILLIDSYDSFTNNLSCLIEKSTGKKVVIVHNDFILENKYENFLSSYRNCIEYIVIGPGPGLPATKTDVGIIRWLFQYFQSHPDQAIPIFGICLGFQCLCYEFGNEIEKLDDVKHGQIYDIHVLPQNNDLYDNESGSVIPSVRYHSLFVDIERLNDTIIPLSICYEVNNDSNSKRVLMAGKHNTLPFYGVQYHPESICTSKGDSLIKNFDKIATTFNKKHRFDNPDTRNIDMDPVFQTSDRNALVQGMYHDHGSTIFASIADLDFGDESIEPVDICDYLISQGNPDFVLLNSASIPGQWSIIGLPIPLEAEVITHSLDNPQHVEFLKLRSKEVDTVVTESVWKIIGEKLSQKYISRETIVTKAGSKVVEEFPFLGGYMGIFSYEEGQHIIVDKLETTCSTPTPDLKLVFVERFLVLDHRTNKWFVMSVSGNRDDHQWCNEFKSKVEKSNKDQRLKINKDEIKLNINSLISDDEEIKFELPSEDTYRKQFELCQEYLHSGDTYELCLTVPLKIYLPKHVESWDVYKILTKKNPSPFSCYMNFDDLTLISSSPERFLTWQGDKSSGDKQVELRPIKGTIKKSPEIDLEKATKILKTPKEMGENLMIVDLIRHDLHHFISNIEVPSLMSVEEYTTVYQLVSVIRGKLNNNTYHGIDILHTSLPPGSMTGAPKKRSVELLQTIEQMQPNALPGGRRGIYSGVVGYWSVTDDSDWSVIIRSIFSYKNDKENNCDHNLWRIGAGGAITVLSNVEDEWEEMRVKLQSALQAFR